MIRNEEKGSSFLDVHNIKVGSYVWFPLNDADNLSFVDKTARILGNYSLKLESCSRSNMWVRGFAKYVQCLQRN